MPQYGWNTAKVGIKHQSTNQNQLKSSSDVNQWNFKYKILISGLKYLLTVEYI
jgi:hypothetical protein